MNKVISTLKTGSRAAMVAALLGASTLTAFTVTPAQAQPSFSFSIGIGGDYSVKKGKKYYKTCLSEKQLYRALRNEGYRNAEIVKWLKGDRVEVVARWKGDWFSLRVDLCTGEVYNVKKIKHYDDDYEDHDDYKPGKPRLEFKFGY